MEIKKEVIDSALKESLTSNLNKDLVKLFNGTDKYSLEDFLQSEEMRKKDHEVWDILVRIERQSQSLDSLVLESCISNLSSVLAFQRHHILQAFNETSRHSLFLFLKINCYLKLPVSVFLDVMKVNSDLFNKLNERIESLVNNIRLDFSVPPETPYHERKWLSDYKAGFAEKDIEKVYYLIDSAERGRGFHYNYLVENTLFFLSEISVNKFVELLVLKKETHEWLFFLNQLTNMKLLEVASHSLISKDCWLNLELIRLINNKHTKGVYEEKEYVILIPLLTRIEEEDFSFFLKVVKYFRSSNLVNAAVGSLLIHLTKEEIKELIDECFVFDKYNFSVDQRRKLLYYYDQVATESDVKDMLRTVFLEWRAFLEGLVGEYCNGLILTDYAYYIISYYSMCITPGAFLRELDSQIERILYIETIWTTDRSHQTTMFAIDFSKLYLLSFVFKDHKIISEIHSEKIKALFDNRILKSRFISNEYQKYIPVILENFSC
ncbi:MAG: hypothetical protein JWM14_1564 [Chitinophagaceae bacterium]|nr:hypothetical protein [Chitinophagaceae bacterium]